MLEKDLLQQIKEGQVSAFEHIYHKYYDFLCCFSMHLLHDRLLVEEVVDDVLFYLWDHREEIRIDSLKGYLVKAVRNRSVNVIKSSPSNRELFFTHITTNESIDFFESLFSINNEKTPLGYLLQNELEDTLLKAIEELPNECRTVFRMSRFDGKKHSEIAEELGISINTVKYHTKNALRILADSLSHYNLLLFLLLYGYYTIL